MCLFRKIPYGEFSEFIREKKIKYNSTTLLFLHRELSGRVCGLVFSTVSSGTATGDLDTSICTCSPPFTVGIKTDADDDAGAVTTAGFHRGIFYFNMTLFINKRFALNKMFQRNASKFAIFYV